MFSILTSFADLIALVGVIVCLFSKKSLGLETMIACIATVLVLLIIYHSTLYTKVEKVEHFATDVPVNSFTSFLLTNGFSSLSNVVDFINGKYTESLASINDHDALTLYYSCFSSTSKPTEIGMKWTNISPYFTNHTMAACPSNNYMEYSHMHFNTTVASSLGGGIDTTNAVIKGPLTFQMGIESTSTFSTFIVFKLHSFVQTYPEFEIFKWYGNTPDNNALRIFINDVTMDMNLPNMAVVKIGAAYNQQVGSLSDCKIFMNTRYMIVFTRTSSNMKMTLHNLDVASITDVNAMQIIINDAPLDEPNILFSNNDMMINRTKTMNMNIFAYGIYNVALTTEQPLREYIQKELYKRSIEFLSSAQSQVDSQNALIDLKSCKFSSDVCNACPDVLDWSNFTNVLVSTSNCIKSIDTYCTANPLTKNCECWDPNTSNVACDSFKQLFKGNACIQPTNLDAETLKTIKIKYGLVDEYDANSNALRNVEPSNSTVVQTKKLAYPPKFIDPNLYVINALDIELYEAYMR